MIACIGQVLLRRTLVLPGQLTLGERHLAMNQRVEAGGEALLTAGALHRLQIPVSLIACAGLDDQGVRLRKQAKDAGLDLSHLFSTRDIPTTVETVIFHRGEHRKVETSAYVPGAADTLSRQNLRDRTKTLQKASVIVVDAALPLDTLDYLGMAKDLRPIPKILNLTPIKPLLVEEPPTWLKGYHYVVAGIRDLAAMSAKPLDQPSTAQDAARQLTKRWETKVILYLDGLGAISPQKEAMVHVPGQAMEIQGPANLRPGFCAGLAAGMWLGMSFLDTLALACRLSALGAHNTGSIGAFPTLDELNQFQQSFS